MSTPTTFEMPPLDSNELIQNLKEAASDQLDATPEPEFQQQDISEGFSYLCKVEHHRFTPEEVDNFRTTIDEDFYWQHEAQCLKEKLSELIWQNLEREHHDKDPTIAGKWRHMVMAYRRKLKRHGCTVKEMRDARLSIKNERYWKPEAECLRQIAALREHEMQERYWEQKVKNQGVGQVQSQNRSEARARSQQRVPRGQAQSRMSTDNRRTGLRSFSATSRVEKRSGKFGVRA